MGDKTEDISDVVVPLVAYVQRQYFENGAPITEQTTKNELLKVERFVTEPARVSVEMANTINMGNFQSAHISVGLVLPCYREEIDGAYNYGREWVEARMVTEVQEARANKPCLF
jgi:hypothetical protein